MPTQSFRWLATDGQHGGLEAALSPSAKSQRKQERNRKIAERAMEETPSLASAEANTALSSTELNAKIDSGTARQLAERVDDAMKSGDAARMNAARLFAKGVDEDRLRILSTNAGESKYHPDKKAFTLTAEGAQTTRTIFHEDRHLHDHQSTVTYTAEKMSKNGTELREYTVTDANYTTLGYGAERAGATLENRLGRASKGGKGDTAAWRDLKKRLGAKTDDEAKAAIKSKIEAAGLKTSEIRSLSDFVHAASNGKVDFKFGHWPKPLMRDGEPVMRDGKPVMIPHWNETTRVIEPWADYGASLLDNPREAALIRELFPVETGIMDEIAEAMLR